MSLDKQSVTDNDKIRCSWCAGSPLYREYHDFEWGRPVHDDSHLFEMIVLEGMQAGLSWLTVLKKRDAFRTAFDNYNLERIIGYNDEKIEMLMSDSGIIRNRLKIKSVVSNAKAFREVQNSFGSFDHFIWNYVDNKPIVNSWRSLSEIPSKTILSDRISKDLSNLGFKFVGSTIIYSFMQAVGIVNDHITDCFVYSDTSLCIT
jgi:DNA-3-methyladenine glycosylase I